jgi:oxygen-independent coproporphyrinogen-3 oxidase
MAGIYIHIPFCKQACHYCDFHFSTTLKHKDAMIEALLRELKIRKDYLGDENIETIYFGGGTPSLLEPKELEKIIHQIQDDFYIMNHPEITLEANPDDLNFEYIKGIQQIGINRLSIGVQSFFNKDLEWMNRAHNSNQAIDSIKRSQDIGIDNISIDLIYGTPDLINKDWKENIHKAFELEIRHISSYALTVEQGTALGNWVSKGKVKALDDEQAAEQFEILMEEMASNDFLHYEISNFCKEGYHSRHNSSYWEGKKYLGIGPSAHSFNKTTRQWNVANNHQYIDQLFKDELPSTTEVLSIEDRINEYLMISLRTSKGISFDYFEKEFGSENLSQLNSNIMGFINNKLLIIENNYCKTTKNGKLMADKIASDLFILKNDN